MLMLWQRPAAMFGLTRTLAARSQEWKSTSNFKWKAEMVVTSLSPPTPELSGILRLRWHAVADGELPMLNYGVQH